MEISTRNFYFFAGFLFGGHFVRNGLSAVNLFLQESPELDFTNQKYGIILGAQNMASCVFLLGGLYDAIFLARRKGTGGDI